MIKEEQVLKYYLIILKLKEVLRSGWTYWNIKKERVESVAEHIYSTQNLAIAMALTYKKNIDLEKVILMIAIHEIEEIIIGDIPMTDPRHKEKEALGHKAVEKILGVLVDSKKLIDLIYEFDERKTYEAKFAYLCDKLDCDIQAKLFDEQDYFDLYSDENKETFEMDNFAKYIEEGAKSFSDAWLMADEHLYKDGEEFKQVFDYVKNNKILKLVDKDFLDINNL